MLVISRDIAIMIGTAAESFVEDTVNDLVAEGGDELEEEEGVWEIITPLIADDAGDDDARTLPTCTGDLDFVGYCASDDADGAAGYLDAIALWCDIMSTDAPDEQSELLALRAGRVLRLAGRMLRGEAGQPSSIVDQLDAGAAS